jgi:hypothetical protein
MLRGTCWFRALGRLVRLLCLAAVFLTLTAPAATAQVVTGTIYGTVADPTGAGVPQAAVTATNIATGVSSTTTADAGGNYRFPSLTPGTYNIRVEKQGFDSSVFSGVNVLLDQTARVDARLQVADAGRRSRDGGGYVRHRPEDAGHLSNDDVVFRRRDQ